MTDFILDGTSLPFPKLDLVPLGAAPPSRYVVASDWNTVCQASIDVQGFLRGGFQLFKTGDATVRAQVLVTQGAPLVSALKGSLAVDVTGPGLYQNQDGASSWFSVGGGSGMTVGGPVTGGTTGSLLFVAAGPVLQQDNAKLFWDNTNDRLGVGTSVPNTTFEIAGAGATAGLAMQAGSATPVGVANTGRLRYNESTSKFQASLNGAAYVDLQTGTEFALDIGEAIGGSTVGSVLFVGAGNVLQQDNARLFWDNTNDRLGVGTATPGTTLDISSATTLAGLAMYAGSTTAVSAAGTGRVRYNEGTNQFQVSMNGAAYVNMVSPPTIGGTVSGATAGSVLFAGVAGVLQQDNASFFWNDTNNVLELKTNHATTGPLNITATTNTAPSAAAFFDNNNNFKGYLGWFNTAYSGFPYMNNRFGWLSISGEPVVFGSQFVGAHVFGTQNTAIFYEMYQGGAAAVAPAATGRIQLNGATFQISTNTGAYFPIGTYAATLTTGSVLFANGSNQIAQDNANFFWDDTNNRLGVGTAVPAVPLDVRHPATPATEAIQVYNTAGGGGDGRACISFRSDVTTSRVWALGIDTVGGTTKDFQLRDVTGSTVRLVMTTAGQLQVPALTTGSVLFVGASGAVLQDNVNFFWDDTNNRLQLGRNGATLFADTALEVYRSGGHCVASIVTPTAASDAVLILGTNNAGGDLAMFLDDSDSMKFKIAVGDVTTDAARNTNTKVTLATDGNVGIGTTPAATFRFSVLMAQTAQECIRVRASSANSYSNLMWFDSADVKQGGVGYGNASVPNTLASLNFLYAPGSVDWIMSDATTNWFRWYATTNSAGFEMANGSGATVSAANTGKLRYTTTGQKFQVSLNAAAYVDLLTASTGALQTTTLTAGAGLTGGGDLSANRTFDVVAHADGSIVVNANDVQVGVLATDAQHGLRGGGTQHAVAVASGLAGFLSGADKQKIDDLTTTYVPQVRTVTAGAGLTGGGDLSADRTFDIGAGSGITVNANDVAVNLGFQFNWTARHTWKAHAAFAGSETHKTTAAVQTTDATQTHVFTLALPDTSDTWIEAEIAGRDTAGVERALYGKIALVYREGGGATLQGAVQDIHADVETSAGLDATITVSANDVRVSVTGLAATTINWVATIKYQTVSGAA